MRMHQFFSLFCFLLKFLHIDINQMQDFDGCLFGSKMHMLAQVDLCEASLTQPTNEAIVAKLLAYELCHLTPPLNENGGSVITDSIQINFRSTKASKEGKVSYI